MSGHYRITVVGCDDSTGVTLELTDEAVAVVREVAEAITAASSANCMPKMNVHQLTDAELELERTNTRLMEAARALLAYGKEGRP